MNVVVCTILLCTLIEALAIGAVSYCRMCHFPPATINKLLLSPQPQSQTCKRMHNARRLSILLHKKESVFQLKETLVYIDRILFIFGRNCEL